MDHSYPLDKNLSHFSLNSIKKKLAKDDSLMRAAFPEDVFDIKKFSQQDPNFYFQSHHPVVSLSALEHIISSNIGANRIMPLEELWFRHHRSLHKLIVNTAIKEALKQQNPDHSQATYYKESYIKFFFAPIAYLPTEQEGIRAFNSSHYRYTNKDCPSWLVPFLKKANLNNEIFDHHYTAMDSIDKELQYLKSQNTVETLCNEQLKKNGYNFSLRELGQQIVPSSTKIIISDQLANDCGSCIINFFQRNNPNNAKNKHYSDIYVHDNLVHEILSQRQLMLKNEKKKAYIDQNVLRKILIEYAAEMMFVKPKKFKLPYWHYDEKQNELMLKDLQIRSKKALLGDL